MKNKKSLGSIIFDGFNYVFFALLCASMLLPFIHTAAVSVSEAGPVMQNKVYLWPEGFNLQSYKYVLSNRYVLLGYGNTLLYTLLGTAINLMLTSATAYALANKRLIFRSQFTFIITFTMLFSGGMIPNYLLVQRMGLINTLWAVVLPGAISTWNLLVMRQFFLAIPDSLEESAMIDGANDIKIFWKIVLPLSKASLATIGLFYAVGHWNSFFGPLIYLNDRTKYPLQIILRSMIIEGNISGGASMESAETETVVQTVKYTVIMVATLPILCVYPFLQKYFVKGVLVGSVKG